ncbi:GntR family transcriptional regulator [Kocuria sp. JC486]|uniref:GntR family transcriptional regulator n=1 Tax=Kocuria sp. JC486 TaxID=1970736 RepID=UPI001ADDE197
MEDRNQQIPSGTRRRRAAPVLPTPTAPLRDQVAASLRHALIVGDFEPGEVLSAPGLAAEFGVSATPVREAMLDLAQEGHVSPIRYKGYRVTDVSAETRRQVIQLRTLIEIPLMGDVAERGVADELLERCRGLAEQSVVAAVDGDLIRFIELDMDLHLSLLEQAGNDIAVKHVRSLRSTTRLTGLKALAEQRQLEFTAREHVELVEAVAAQDRSRTEEIMQRHLGHVAGVWAGKSE